jgi:hypothetical protein
MSNRGKPPTLCCPISTLSVVSMVSAEATAIIAGASALAGGAIVAMSNYVINRAQAADTRKAELRRATRSPRTSSSGSSEPTQGSAPASSARPQACWRHITPTRRERPRRTRTSTREHSRGERTRSTSPPRSTSRPSAPLGSWASSPPARSPNFPTDTDFSSAAPPGACSSSPPGTHASPGRASQTRRAERSRATTKLQARGFMSR